MDYSLQQNLEQIKIKTLGCFVGRGYVILADLGPAIWAGYKPVRELYARKTKPRGGVIYETSNYILCPVQIS